MNDPPLLIFPCSIFSLIRASNSASSSTCPSAFCMANAIRSTFCRAALESVYLAFLAASCKGFSAGVLLGSMSTTRPAGLGFSSSSTTFLLSLWLIQGLSGVQHVRLWPFTMASPFPVCRASADTNATAANWLSQLDVICETRCDKAVRVSPARRTAVASVVSSIRDDWSGYMGQRARAPELALPRGSCGEPARALVGAWRCEGSSSRSGADGGDG